jgi:acyl-CoA synthetase (NDP forming)
MSLETLFAPRSVAIAGLSRRPGTVGERCLATLLRHGYQGDVFGVHPEAERIGGVRCWRTIDELPVTPDVTVLLRPGEETIGATRAAGARGTPWVLACGTLERPALRERLAGAAWEAGTRIVGPNTEGLWDLRAHAVLSFGTVAYADELIDGPAAVISQSGGVGAAMARTLCASGLGCRTFIGTGDELALTVTEVLAHLAPGGYRLIAVYLEAVDDLAALRDAVEAATIAGAVVAVLKVGRSDAGARIAASHAGRIAGHDAL